MAFEPGREKTGGRQPGTMNKKTLLRAAAVLADKGLSPTEELVKIAQDEATPVETRISLWKFLQSYVEAPQTIATPPAPDSPEESVERAKVMAGRLAELSRPLDPGAPPKP
jgi:hypothetical protein